MPWSTLSVAILHDAPDRRWHRWPELTPCDEQAAETNAAPHLRWTEHGDVDAPLRLFEAAGSSLCLRRSPAAAGGVLFVLLQLEGCCVFRHGGREIRLEQGSFNLSEGGEACELEWPGNFRSVMIAVPAARLSQLRPDWRWNTQTTFANRDGATAVFADTVRSLLHHPASLRGAAARSIGETLIGLLAAALSESEDAKGADADSRLEYYHKQRIHKFIRAELSNPELDIALIARSVGLSQRYIHRLFADEPLHLMQSVWAQRLDHCRHDLLRVHSLRRPISEIAYAWGFNDAAHFSRVFRKRFGLTPSDLRRRAGAQQEKSHHASDVGTFEQATIQS